jgi:hypothetical protein
MNERLLQYAWQFQVYNTRELRTTKGEIIKIVKPGTFNLHQGPDFLDARISIDGHLLAGNVEIHVLSSDWIRHGHEDDINYQNLVLHVVWQDDLPRKRVAAFPTLELEGRIPLRVVERYARWQRGPEKIVCGGQISGVRLITWSKWKERLIIERLHYKSAMLQEWLQSNNFHWEETLWWVIARSFGLVVNADAFSVVARSIPWNVLKRHSSHVLQVEAFLFGQAGLINANLQDHYARRLWEEFNYLKNKYGLPECEVRMHFLRMRPAGFPTRRIAQLAMFVHRFSGTLVNMLDIDDIGSIKKMFDVKPSEYWDHHYIFDVSVAHQLQEPGKDVVNAILINGVIPFMYLYGQHINNRSLVEKAFRWLGQLPAEHNSVTRDFERFGVSSSSAIDTQALVQLRAKYCEQRRCLDCSVGHEILKGERVEEARVEDLKSKLKT